ncbi:E3 ubiquitin-protein ligase [Trichinella pseudospiralis]
MFDCEACRKRFHHRARLLFAQICKLLVLDCIVLARTCVHCIELDISRYCGADELNNAIIDDQLKINSNFCFDMHTSARDQSSNAYTDIAKNISINKRLSISNEDDELRLITNEKQSIYQLNN